MSLNKSRPSVLIKKLKHLWGVSFTERSNLFTCENNNVFFNHTLRKGYLCVKLQTLLKLSCSKLVHVNNNDFEREVKVSDDDFEKDATYDDLVKRAFRSPESGHQVFVIQPYIKWGPTKNNLTKPEYQLNESVALIETLKNWKVVDQEKISLLSFKKVKFFGTGNLELLKEKIHKNKLITAVFLSVNLLSRAQQEFLEDFFHVPVYDRYNIIMQIFHQHAISKEAKLQVAMAEVPFMWYRIKSSDDKGGGGVASIGGSGETLLEVRKRILTEREQKIKKALKKLVSHRTLLRNKRKKKEFPVIAVVGYTNAGKTSLIKALTQEDQLQPENKLFATLDVTMHSGLLPSNIRVLYADTIGFISDIPTELIEPFNVTLEDALQSDVLIHVLDVSNPDLVAQSHHTINTLHRLKLNQYLLDNMIHVGNKCDLKTEAELKNLEVYDKIKDLIYVSCVKQINISNLRIKIERTLLKMTGRIPIKIRIKSGGPEYQWLYKESSVVSVSSDDSDSDFVLMNVIITEGSLMKFKHKFINSHKVRK